MGRSKYRKIQSPKGSVNSSPLGAMPVRRGSFEVGMWDSKTVDGEHDPVSARSSSGFICYQKPSGAVWGHGERDWGD